MRLVCDFQMHVNARLYVCVFGFVVAFLYIYMYRDIVDAIDVLK